MLTFTSSVNHKNNSHTHHKNKEKEYESICLFCCV